MAGSSRRRPPEFVQPQLATLVREAPEGEAWVHEIKYDGYRLLARIDGSGVRLLTRNRQDWTARFPAIASALRDAGLDGSLVDGEAVVELPDGTTSFQALQNALRRPSAGRIRYVVFDALWLGGAELVGRPLVARKEALQTVVAGMDGSVIGYSDHVEGHGAAFLESACAAGLEGIISKRRNAAYRSGRGTDWLKVKCVRVQEFVIGGFSEPAGSRQGLGALHVGTFDDRGRLVYRGKVGTGFTEATLRELRRRLERMRRATPPFVNAPRGTAVRGTTWVSPELVAQIRYTEVTDDGRLRHPSFEGLREDKAAREVRMEPGGSETGSRGGATAQRTGRASPSAGPPARARGDRSRARRGAGIDVAGVRITHPDRVVYREQGGVTKLAVVQHYERVAERMLPHVAGRPLTLVRCPSGSRGKCFYQKHMDETAPAAVRRVRVQERDGPAWYGTVRDVAGLISLVQLGTLEFHTSNARADRLDRPDRFLIDLDPGASHDWSEVVEAAFRCRAVLADLGLESFAKTTGGKGLHVVVPLVRRSTWDEVLAFAQGVASLLVESEPERYTVELQKRRRHGRMLLDYFRNAHGATAIEAYSTRARPGAPVAVPIDWAELENDVRSNSFNVANLPDRLARPDPWKDYGAVKQSITVAMRKRLGPAGRGRSRPTRR